MNLRSTNMLRKLQNAIPNAFPKLITDAKILHAFLTPTVVIKKSFLGKIVELEEKESKNIFPDAIFIFGNNDLMQVEQPLKFILI